MLPGPDFPGEEPKLRSSPARAPQPAARGTTKSGSRFGRRRRQALAAAAGDAAAPVREFSIDPVHALEDIAQRRGVWVSLASLFLTTEPPLSPAARTAQLAASPYTPAQLEQILIYEVYPVCTYYMMSVAGAWAGFSGEWIEARILERLRSRWRFLRGLNVGRITVPLFGKWQKTKRAIEALRQAGSDPAPGK